MDSGLVEKAIESNRPFVVKTAAGDAYPVPHRDFIAFSKKRTSLVITFEEDGKESFAIVPLLTVTSVEVEGSVESAQVD